MIPDPLFVSVFYLMEAVCSVMLSANILANSKRTVPSRMSDTEDKPSRVRILMEKGGERQRPVYISMESYEKETEKS